MLDFDQRTLTAAQRRKILERDDYCCMYCYGPADEVDHIIPWSFQHNDSPENLVASCWLCNRMASNFMFKTFSRKRDFIQHKRRKFIEGNPIPLWLSSDIEKLGRGLKDYICKSVVVCESVEDLRHVMSRLLSEGWQVNVGGKVIDKLHGIRK